MGKRIDLTGKRFGRLVVLKDAGRNKWGSYLWECKCDCGIIKNISSSNLNSARSCGCTQHKIKNRCGQSYGQLTVLKLHHLRKGRGSFWVCLCACGNTTVVHGGDLQTNHTKSCGCLSKLPMGVAALNYTIGQIKREAKRRGYDFRLAREKVRELSIQDCYYCGKAPTVKKFGNSRGLFGWNGIDRVDNSKGYVEGNVVACCTMCNVMKLDHTVKRFLEHVTKITKHQKNKV